MRRTGMATLSPVVGSRKCPRFDVKDVDYVGRDEESDMRELVSRVVTNINLPLMLDSTEWQKMEVKFPVAAYAS